MGQNHHISQAPKHQGLSTMLSRAQTKAAACIADGRVKRRAGVSS